MCLVFIVEIWLCDKCKYKFGARKLALPKRASLVLPSATSYTILLDFAKRTRRAAKKRREMEVGGPGVFGIVLLEVEASVPVGWKLAW